MTDIPVALETPEPAPKKRNPFLIFVGALVVVLLVFGAVGAFALLRVNSFGDRMASAEAMPAGTDVYIDFDFGSLGDLDRLFGAFDAAFAEAGVDPSIDSILDEIDTELRSAFGVGVEDIKPWVGHDVGVGISNIDIGILEGSPAIPDVLAAISVRDRDGADAFIEKMVSILVGRDFVVFSESTYQDVRILVSETDVAGTQIAVARSGDLILLGSSESAVRRGIDAQAGESLADDPSMADALDALPDDRAMTVYVNGRLFDELLAGLEDQLGQAFLDEAALPQFPENTIESLAMSAALTEDGVQLDFVEVLREGASGGFDANLGLLGLAGSAASADLPAQFPEDTFIYVGIDGSQTVTGEPFSLSEALEQSGFGPEELAQFGLELEQIEAELGFNIQTDLIDLIGGDFGLGVFSSDSPIFGEGPFVGFSALLGVTDAARMAGTIDKVADFATQSGAPLSSLAIDNGTLYGFSDGGADFFVFGVAGDFLVAASEAGAVSRPTGRTLADNELFKRAADALPQAGPPVFFVDLRAALAAFDAPPEVVRFINPIEGMAANADSEGRIVRVTLLTLIEY